MTVYLDKYTKTLATKFSLTKSTVQLSSFAVQNTADIWYYMSMHCLVLLPSVISVPRKTKDLRLCIQNSFQWSFPDGAFSSVQFLCCCSFHLVLLQKQKYKSMRIDILIQC